VVAVVFLYQITFLLQQNITTSLLELYFYDSMQTVRTAAVAVKKVGRCSIYRHHIMGMTRVVKTVCFLYPVNLSRKRPVNPRTVTYLLAWRFCTSDSPSC